MFCEVAPRPRNAEATRAAILTAARERFSRESYDDVGMRDIAGDVGVDAALVSRYFGSKEDLFLKVLEHCGDAPDLMDGDRATFGDRVAREAIFGSEHDGQLEHLLVLLRSIGSAKASELVRRTADESFFSPFQAWIGGHDAPVRARRERSQAVRAYPRPWCATPHRLPADRQNDRRRSPGTRCTRHRG